MNRRNFITAGAACIAGGSTLAFPGLALAQPSVVRFGQTAALSGPMAADGIHLRNGILAAFDSASKADGGKGPRFELASLDDAHSGERCNENIKTLLGTNVSGLIGLTHGAGAEAAMGLIEQSQVALLGTASGNMGLRGENRSSIFNVRAGYDLEFRRMVGYVKELGQKRVGIAYIEGTSPANLAAMTMALAEISLAPVETVVISAQPASFKAAGDKLLAARLDSVLFMAPAEPIMSILAQMRKAEYRGAVFASSLAGESLVNTLVEQRQSAILSMVVPRPNAISLAVVNRCQQDLAAMGSTDPMSVATLEGYISGRIAVDAVRSTLQGGAMSRMRLRESLSRLRADLGGYKVQFAPGSTQGSKYVELISVDRFGRIVA